MAGDTLTITVAEYRRLSEVASAAAWLWSYLARAGPLLLWRPTPEGARRQARLGRALGEDYAFLDDVDDISLPAPAGPAAVVSAPDLDVTSGGPRAPDPPPARRDIDVNSR